MLCWCPPTIRTFSMCARTWVALKFRFLSILRILARTFRKNGSVLCTVRIRHYGGGGWSHFFPGILPTEKAFFPWICPPSPLSPESKFWEGLHNAMRRKFKFLNPIYRSLSRYQSCRFRYLFWQKLIFTLQIEDYFFLNLNSESIATRM